MKKWILLLICCSLHAEAWFTGPLIAPPGRVIPLGHFLIRTHIPSTVYKGGFLSVNPQIFCFAGLASWCDLNVIPQFFYQYNDREHDVQFGDLTVGFDFQLCPTLKLAIREVFPTGNFELLRPKKMWTDLSGEGTFGTQAALMFYKEYQSLAVTASAEYTINSSVHVRGFNAFGGGFGTTGKARPGNVFEAILSFEYSLSQNWAVSLDNVYNHRGETHFSGRPGIALTRTYATVGCPTSDQLSFALGLEYNFSAKLGIIAGYWLSAYSRNTPEFQSGVVNLVYEY